MSDSTKYVKQFSRAPGKGGGVKWTKGRNTIPYWQTQTNMNERAVHVKMLIIDEQNSGLLILSNCTLYSSVGIFI